MVLADSLPKQYNETLNILFVSLFEILNNITDKTLRSKS